MLTSRNFITSHHLAAEITPSTVPSLPKRISTFGKFIQDYIQSLPHDMPGKDKFSSACTAWKKLPDEQKEIYRQKSREAFVEYKKQMAALTPEEKEALREESQASHSYYHIILKLISFISGQN